MMAPVRTTARVLAYAGLVLAGLVAGVSLLLAAELALCLAGVSADRPRHDPFAGFSRVVPLFESATRADGTRVYRLSATHRRRDATGKPVTEPQREFLAEKAPGMFRVFVVGASSAAGVPYGTDYAFPAWLARRLEAEIPSVRCEVVNAAIPGYATRRMLTVVREIAAYAPDLLIVYEGHNEFAERRFYAHLLDIPAPLFRLWERIVGTRLFAVLSRLAPSADGAADRQPPRFDIDDLRNAAQMFAVLGERAAGRGYPTPRDAAYGEMLYRFNLEEMVRAMDRVGARVMLLTLSQNFADWAPGASSHRDGLSAAEEAAWEESVAEGDRLAGEHDCTGALQAYARALTIDDAFADLHYREAGCARALGRFDAARLHYRLASDLDRVPHGAPTRYNDILREVARAQGAMLVDVEEVLRRASPHGLVGDDLFVDFVHPNIRAHQLIAAAIDDALRAAGLPVPAVQWLTGAYIDPDPEALYRADESLRTQEHLVRAVACLLARRDACARTEADAVLAAEPDHRPARLIRDGVAPSR